VRGFVRAAVAVGLVAAGLVSVAPGLAQASDAGFALPLTTYRDMAVANGYVFVDGLGEGVVVRNADGSAKAVIDEPGAMDVEASPDGSRVYVALGVSGPGIAVIDTTTLTEVARYATGTCTNTLAVQGDLLWYGRCTGPPYDSSIGVVDVSHSKPRIIADVVAGFPTPPYLAASPGRLFAWQDSFSPSTLDAYDVSGTTLTRTGGFWDISDLSVAPDGQSIVVAGGGFHSQRYRAADLTAEQTYTTGLAAAAVAAAPNGVVATGTTDWPPVIVHNGAGDEVRSYNFGDEVSGTPWTLTQHSLLFADEGNTLYAVSEDGYGHSPTLHVLTSPLAPLAPSQLTVDAPAPVQYGQPYSLTGRLTSGGVPIANAVVRLVEGKEYYPEARTTQEVRTTATGDFSVSYSDSPVGTWSFEWVYDGDDIHGPASGSGTRVVVPAQTTMAVAADRTTPYTYGATARVTAHLGGLAMTGLVVSFFAQPAGGSKTLVWWGQTDTHGDVVMPYVMRKATTFEADYAGDTESTSSSAQVSVTAHARVSDKLTGYYSTLNSWRLFHASAPAAFTAQLSPNKSGECVRLRIQRYLSSAWSTTSATCHRLTTTSSLQAQIKGAAGSRYRVRAEFGGDAANVATNGSWLYLKFTT
jgi:hypothetical protein